MSPALKEFNSSGGTEQLVFFVFSFVVHHFFNVFVSVEGTYVGGAVLGIVLAFIIVVEHFASRAVIRYGQSVQSERVAAFFARKIGSFVLLLLYSLHAFSLIALFAGILTCFFSDMNVIPDWYIGLGGTLLFVKDISLFYSLKNKTQPNLQRSIQKIPVSLFHRLILISVSIVIMLVLWEKTVESGVNMNNLVTLFASSFFFTFLYIASRVPSLIVDISEPRPRKMIRLLLGYFAVLIFQMLMLY